MTPAKRKKWSQRVTEESHALDLEPGLFTFETPADIARSLKRSAEHSDRRKADPFCSAMSMLTFYINRAGRYAITPNLVTEAWERRREMCDPCET